MGTDIHAFIEYDNYYFPDRAHNFAKINITRNYWLFTILAGVRGESIQGQTPVSEPKGLPEKKSWKLMHEAYYFVLDLEETSEPRCCTRKTAEKWGSKYVDEKKLYVEDPDWHSHSWLSLQEVDEVIRRYSKLKIQDKLWLDLPEQLPTEYKVTEIYDDNSYMAVKEDPAIIPMEIIVIRDMMRSLEFQGNKSRFVFWFDN